MATKATGPTVGLDIGTKFIKAVEMRPGRGSPHLNAIAIAPTPPNTFVGDIISDPAFLGAYIKKMLKDAGIAANKAVASVSGQTSFAIRPLPVPVMTDKELAESMRWEVERYIPFRPEDTIRDFKRLPSVNPGANPDEMVVLLVAAQKQLIDNVAGTLLNAGLTPVALDAEPLSLVRTVPLHEVKNNCVAVVNVGGTKTDIGVFDRGVLVYPRTFPIAGNNITQAIADSLGLPMEQAERLKSEFGEVPEDRDVASSPFEHTTGFGPFDLPGATPVTDADETPQTEEYDMGGFTVPDDEEGDGLISFHLDEDEETPSAAGGGFSFTLDDEDAPAAPPPNPGPPTQSSFSSFGEPAETPANEPTFESESVGGVPAPLSEDELMRRRIADAIVPVFNDLSVEIRRSIEYYANRPGGRPVDKVYIFGGASRMRGFASALEQDLGVSVQLLDPSRNFLFSGKNAQPGYYAEVGPVIALAIGLGSRDLVPEAAPETASASKPAKPSKSKAA
jgi:type IV pilus assembly protein PilM